MAAGAGFFLTQPVFSKEDAERIRRIKASTGARILCGIMPLISRKNALFMKNEIAGIHVPDEIIERYPEEGSKEAGEAMGRCGCQRNHEVYGRFYRWLLFFISV